MSDFLQFDPDSEDVEVINREVIEHDEAITDRSLARRVSLQCLYEIDSVGHPLGTVLDNNINYSPERRRVKGYIVYIVKGVMGYLSAIDAVLQKYAAEWPIDQVAVVDRNILRIALFELAIDKKHPVPVGVAIDEAIELAKLFGAENTPRFINGVLGTVADNLSAVGTYLMSHAPAEAEKSISEIEIPEDDN
jgi:transcription antitermination protein NusB